MSLPFRILSMQAGVLCFGCSFVGLAALTLGLVTLWASLSMLMGGLVVLVPAWLYALATNEEHRPNRLLLLAWLKLVASLVLLTLAVVWGKPSIGWLLSGLGLAYIAHALAAWWLTRPNESDKSSGFERTQMVEH